MRFNDPMGSLIVLILVRLSVCLPERALGRFYWRFEPISPIIHPKTSPLKVVPLNVHNPLSERDCASELDPADGGFQCPGTPQF